MNVAIYSKPDGVPRRKGSRGGSTFTKTCNGFIIRRRFKSKNRKTPLITELRSRFSAASQHWRAMSSGDKNRYVVKTPQFVFTNSLGNNYTLAPSVLQNKFSIIKLSNQSAYQEICADNVFVEPPIILGGGAFANPPFLSLNYNSNTASTDIITYIYMTRQGTWQLPFSNLNALKLVDWRFFDQDGSIDMLPFYRSAFGIETFKVGQSVTFWIRNLRRSTSQWSEPTALVLYFN